MFLLFLAQCSSSSAFTLIRMPMTTSIQSSVPCHLTAFSHAYNCSFSRNPYYTTQLGKKESFSYSPQIHVIPFLSLLLLSICKYYESVFFFFNGGEMARGVLCFILSLSSSSFDIQVSVCHCFRYSRCKHKARPFKSLSL